MPSAEHQPCLIMHLTHIYLYFHLSQFYRCGNGRLIVQATELAAAEPGMKSQSPQSQSLCLETLPYCHTVNSSWAESMYCPLLVCSI